MSVLEKLRSEIRQEIYRLARESEIEFDPAAPSSLEQEEIDCATVELKILKQINVQPQGC